MSSQKIVLSRAWGGYPIHAKLDVLEDGEALRPRAVSKARAARLIEDEIAAEQLADEQGEEAGPPNDHSKPPGRSRRGRG